MVWPVVNQKPMGIMLVEEAFVGQGLDEELWPPLSALGPVAGFSDFLVAPLSDIALGRMLGRERPQQLQVPDDLGARTL